MPDTLALIRLHVIAGRVRVSEHGMRELSDDEIDLSGVIDSLDQAVIVEDYPDYSKGPCVLCLHTNSLGQPVHVLWGIASGTSDIATIVTAYRPAPERWMGDFMTRRPK
jgi:Domain of unknown function (DUF4258)